MNHDSSVQVMCTSQDDLCVPQPTVWNILAQRASSAARSEQFNEHNMKQGALCEGRIEEFEVAQKFGKYPSFRILRESISFKKIEQEKCSYAAN
jgi:hypothetical protein